MTDRPPPPAKLSRQPRRRPDAPHFATPAADLLFEQCASPAAIAAELDKTLAAVRRAERRANWLRALLARRTAEKAAGIWPPREDPR